MELINFNSENEIEVVLKDLTDFLGVRHDKALAKVMKMAEEPIFGTLSVLDIVYNEQGQKTRTAVLNKKQTIAVSARLNDGLLMKVVNLLEEATANVRELTIELKDAQRFLPKDNRDEFAPNGYVKRKPRRGCWVADANDPEVRHETEMKLLSARLGGLCDDEIFEEMELRKLRHLRRNA